METQRHGGKSRWQLDRIREDPCKSVAWFSKRFLATDGTRMKHGYVTKISTLAVGSG